MPTTLRQRHGHHNDESSSSRHQHQHPRININNESIDDVTESIIYNPKKTKASSFIIKIAPWSIVFGLLCLILLLYYSLSTLDWSRGIILSSATTQDKNNNLKLITIYPWQIAKTIHRIEGQTELLISNDNREGVEAVRTSIAMANSLRRKRRHRNLLLRITNVIAAISTSRQSGSVDDTSSNNGDVELEAYGEAKMREYLLEHGEKCSFDDDHRGKSSGGGSISSDIIQLIDLIYSSNNEVNNEIENNFVWDVVIRLFTWCQISNGHARGYITHGTFLNMQHVLEDCRLKGVGVIADTAQSMNGLHYSPLFIIPIQSENNDGAQSSRDVSLQSLQSYLAMWRTTVDSSPPMSFAVEGRYLNQWTPEQWKVERDGGGVAEGWLLLK